MKNRYFLILIISVFILFITGASVHANTFQYNNYDINFNHTPNFSILPNGGHTSIFDLQYLSIYEITLPHLSIINTSYQSLENLTYHQFPAISSTASVSQNYSTTLDNGAIITFEYIRYKNNEIITIGSQDFTVSPDELHVRYIIDNWPFQGNNSVLGIHSQFQMEKPLSGTGYKGRQDWYMNTTKAKITGKIIAKSNSSTSIFNDDWYAPEDKVLENKSTIYVGGGSNGSLMFENFGIGALRGTHVVTNMIYTIETHQMAIFVLNNVGAVVGAIAIGGAASTAVVYNKYFRKRNPTGQSKIISEIFQSRSVLYYYLLGTVKINDEEIEDKLQDAVPHELLSFKFLMDPIRLSIAKLLYESIDLTTVELKDILNIDWNKLNNNLSALKEKGYVDSNHVFDKGTRRQVVTLLPYGIQQYKILTELLHLFLDTTTEIEIDNYTLKDDADLFPKK